MVLTEALRALKFGDEVESPDPKEKGKELKVQQHEGGQDDHVNNCPAKNLIMDLDEQQHEHNLERH